MTVSPEAKILKLVSQLSLYLNFELSCDTHGQIVASPRRAIITHKHIRACMPIHTHTYTHVHSGMVSEHPSECLGKGVVIMDQFRSCWKSFYPQTARCCYAWWCLGVNQCGWHWLNVSIWCSVSRSQGWDPLIMQRAVQQDCNIFITSYTAVAMSGDRLFVW